MSRSTVLLAPNPGLMTGPGTNTYLVGTGGELACIDPGPDDERHLGHILAAVESSGARLGLVLLTHSHPDHRPLARRLAARTGAPIRCREPWRDDDGAQPLHDGEAVSAGGIELVAVHTPGHAGDHLCFHDAAGDALYTGDHVLSGSTTVIAPPDGDMTAYMESLERVLALRPATLHPGHGARIDGGVAAIETYIAHRRRREAQVEAAVRERGDGTTAVELVPEIYADYARPLWPMAALSVEAHLVKLAREGRVVVSAEDGVRRYRAA